MEGLISSLREATDKAICVGFGVSGPDQVRRHVCSTPTGPTLVRSSSDRTNEPMRRLGGPRHVAGTSCARNDACVTAAAAGEGAGALGCGRRHRRQRSGQGARRGGDQGEALWNAFASCAEMLQNTAGCAAHLCIISAS